MEKGVTNNWANEW